ncbi:UPF0276 protein LLO_0755 [Candidatus Rickettsiella viridis]|uniref:UPF0276 protein RVIR1_05320 n=1 Tax=Candidatus Rickettsiella viridis TaxID=676208 RepID=A0A2Z5V713_9COXI|nr:DUF692 domain-containing protein [Candidatus Rickettsiella viridis]BBB15037.1 UPF0276 protein LLO_0755 [Candidatus Rickettsiella viridis]
MDEVFLGFGLGLRAPHYSTILESRPKVDWFEAITEDYLVPGGRPLYYLNRIREHYPLVMHGVSLSIGSGDGINFEYLKKVKALAASIQPAWISDHLCWTGIQGLNMHDLLPLPYTEESLNHVVNKIKKVQDFLGRQILLENVSSYIEYQASMMKEWDFLAAIAEQADCFILLDINNIYVSSINHQFNPLDYLNAIPAHRVRQFHLAGHKNCGTHIIDTHDAPIIDSVWSLYAAAVRRFAKVSTMIERDDNIPALSELLTELQQARQIAETVWKEEDVFIS